jgi:hypothetical protein
LYVRLAQYANLVVRCPPQGYGRCTRRSPGHRHRGRHNRNSQCRTERNCFAALLVDRGITFDANDLLSPGPRAQISNGLKVDLTTAVQLTVVDGAQRYAQLVTAKTVAGARTQLDLPSSSRTASAPFAPYSFGRAAFFTVAGAQLVATDRVHEGNVAVVHDVRIGFAAKDLQVQRKVEVNRSKLLPSGTKRLYQQGHSGRKHVVYRRTIVDQQFQSRTVVQSHWLKKPTKRVVRVGTGPNWIGLANCESGGSTNAASAAGFYGLYQFSLSTWHAVGGKGNPTDYGYWEQTKRAWILYKGSGASSWPTCGQYL